MQNSLKIGLIGFVATILMSGCVSGSYDVKGDKYIYIEKDISSTNIAKNIIDAGRKNGWRMTEFKENEIVAENISDSDAKAVSIHFTNKYFFTRPENDDLNEIIEKAFQK